MKISNQPLCLNRNNAVNANNNTCYAKYSYGIQQDTFTPSFSGLKKSMFKAFDFAVVEKFKSPIEKFKSMEDFEAWAEEEYYKICSHNFGGRTGEVKYKRESMVCDWDQELSRGDYTNAEKLLIMNGITKELKANNENICPAYNRTILNQTLNELKSKLAEDKKLSFDFGKMYRKNLVDMYKDSSNATNNETKWIVIPSKDNDPVHFKENVQKLQTLSTDEMCTKFTGADFHLRNGDIHIYMENNKPKVLLRLNDGVVQEINSEHNDYRIAKEYVDLTEKYMFEHDLVTTEKAEDMLRQSKLGETAETPVKEAAEQAKKDGGFFRFIKKFFS